ncbi:hypothetical protein KKA03_01665, partial [archaeon]|nr:hypothetical protein [archaeon]
RVSAEKTILEDSLATYGRPVDVDSEWGNKSEFDDWKNRTAKKIKEQAEKEIFDFYYGGDEEALKKQYYNPSTDFNFENFIKDGGVEVSITPDSYDASTKTQNALELTVGFTDGGIISAKNKFTGYELTMTAGTNVSVDARPFTMADKAYDFTEKFNNEDKADNIAWRMWGIQTVLGLFEANVKRNVKYATDDRVSYSLMHLLVAIEELETFGTFDYVHTTVEILRPWIGAEDEASEFFSILSLSMEESNVDEAIGAMDAALFVHNTTVKIQEISNSMILASSYLDSSTVTEDGVGFEKSEVKKEFLSGEGTAQHLKKAANTEKLTNVYDEIVGTGGKKEKVTNSKNNVEDSTVDSLSVADQISDIDFEYKEVRSEWEEAESDFLRSKYEIISVRGDYFSLNSTFNNEICTNPIAAMLWFGDSNQNVKGFREVLSSKFDETNELVGYYGELEKAVYNLSYDSFADSYQIDGHYGIANASLNKAETRIQSARSARTEYIDQKYKYDNCRTHFDETDPEMDECLGTGQKCNFHRCNFHKCNCETDEDGEESCDTCWDTCWQICYYCVCDKKVLKNNYEKANKTYVTQMWLTEDGLTDAAPEVPLLQTQINAFFTDKGLADVYPMIENTHGMNEEVTTQPFDQTAKPYSISNNYYAHWDYSCSGDKKYECAEDVLDPSSDIDETNYEDMPKSPLTYDSAHKDNNNYGLYYLKFVIDRMNETFGASSINSGELAEGKKKLNEMKDKGFFAKMNAILKPIKALIDGAGDIKSAIAKVKNAEAGFPNSREHFYTTLPLPPLDIPGVDIDDQGFSVVHDIRLRADTSPGRIKIPFIKDPISLGDDDGINPSFPIPYTPIFVYLWQFDITPCKVGTDDNGANESSTLWLMDIENNQVAPLMEMKMDEYDIPVPFYVHKPTMYKYEFTPKQTFTKKIDAKKLPPVFVIAAGPFRTRFGSYVEPPDKEVTDDPVPIDVYFDREFADESAVMDVVYKKENIAIKHFISLTESVSLNSTPISEEDEKEITVSTKNLTLLREYGWSEVQADVYATSVLDELLDIKNIQGEDHARVYFIDPTLESIEVRLERNGPNLKVINDGNKKIDVSVDQKAENSCLFISHKGNMSKSWIGLVEPGSPIDLAVFPENNVIITAKVLMPEKVEEELERRGIPLKLQDQT